jgi:ubiquitin-conjugating enzyme E2 variant
MTRRLIAIADGVNVALAALCAAALLARLAASAGDAQVVPFLLALPLGFASADAASGFVHWFGDTCFRPDTPVLGRMLIAPFREHHADPQSICRHRFLERNGNNCLAALPFLAAAAFLPWDAQRAWQAFGVGWLASAALTLCATNQIHAWAHAPAVPRWVRALQRSGILLSPERHARHHRRAHDRAYAVVCGWSNAWLDSVLPKQRKR